VSTQRIGPYGFFLGFLVFLDRIGAFFPLAESDAEGRGSAGFGLAPGAPAPLPGLSCAARFFADVPVAGTAFFADAPVAARFFADAPVAGTAVFADAPVAGTAVFADAPVAARFFVDAPVAARFFADAPVAARFFVEAPVAPTAFFADAPGSAVAFFFAVVFCVDAPVVPSFPPVFFVAAIVGLGRFIGFAGAVLPDRGILGAVDPAGSFRVRPAPTVIAGGCLADCSG